MSTNPKPSYIHYYPEPLPGGRAILRVDVVVDGELIESHTDGSPAPMDTVCQHERTVQLASRCACYKPCPWDRGAS